MSIDPHQGQDVLQHMDREPLPGSSSPSAWTMEAPLEAQSLSQVLLHIATRLHSTLEVETLLDVLIQQAMALVGARGGCSGLYTPQGMVCHRYFRGACVLPLDYCWPPNHGLPGWLIVQKPPYLTNDAQSDAQMVPELCRHFGIHSALSIPILDAHGDILSFFEVHN
jgi:hypothetical protein